MNSLVIFERSGPHAVLTLNRPEKLNALNYALIEELMACLREIDADDSLRAVVLTGTGSKAFSAGADIAGFAPDLMASPEQAYRQFASRGQAMTRCIEAFAKPIIAAVNGLAFGGGCETVEACALAIAAEHALFAKPEIQLGFPPPFGGTQRLPRLVGRKRALQMLLTGDAIDARRAEAIGLINAVVPAGQLIDAALTMAARITRYQPVAVATTLRAVNRGINLSIDEGLQAEAAQFMIAAGSPSARQATAAWLARQRQAAADTV